MQTTVLYLCYIVLILLFSSAYNTSLIYCFAIWCLHTNKRRPCSSTVSGHPSSIFFVFLILYRRPFCSQRSLLKTRVLLYSHWLIAGLDSLNISLYIYIYALCNCCSGHWAALPPARQDEGRTDSDLPPVRGDTSLVDVFILGFLGLSRTATATAAWPRLFSSDRAPWDGPAWVVLN